MITRTRNVVLLGLVLLTGTVLGTGWVLHQPASGGDGPGVGGNTTDSMVGVIGLAYVDIEPGISFLHPIQPGRVTQVFVQEGDEVKEGDLLLSLENTMARQRLEEAEAALDAAKHELSDNEESLPKKRQRAIEIQQAKLEAAEHHLEKARKGLEIQRKTFKNTKGQFGTEDDLALTESEVKSIEAAVKAQRAALEDAKDANPKGTIDRLRAQVRAKQAQRDLARQAFLECDLYAPADGIVLRLFATPGDVLGATSKTPAVHFCPDLPHIIRTEILQEWASKVQPGQVVYIEDDTRNGAQWKGKVARVSNWFSQRRFVLLEPFQYNDVRTLECIIYLDPGSRPLRMHQRVRVTIK
jgi:multidrug resistance efflux pump